MLVRGHMIVLVVMAVILFMVMVIVVDVDCCFVLCIINCYYFHRIFDLT